MAWTLTSLPVLTPERLLEQLEELDITNQDAAYLAGVSVATVYRWLKGDTPIPASVVRMFELQIHIRQGARLAGISWSIPEEQEAGDVVQQA